MIKAVLANQPSPQLHQRSVDNILYTLDCTDLLDKFELILNPSISSNTKGLLFSSIRTRKGLFIEFKIATESLHLGSEYQDYNIIIRFDTIAGSTKSAAIKLRVHK